jgi:predicted DNA-binding transcriptional regulator AlpA
MSRYNVKTMTPEEVLALPTSVGIETAARAFGMSRAKAYQLAKSGEFPVPVLALGKRYRVPTAPIKRLLGLDGPDHTDDTHRPTSNDRLNFSRAVRRPLDFSEPVYMKSKGKRIRIDPDKTYKYKGREGVSGAEIIAERQA